MNRSIHHSSDPRSGSALLIVLGVMAILSVLVAGFGRGLRADLRASDGFYQEARNGQLALSALAAAKIELLKAGASMYANSSGQVYFVTQDESYESEIADLSLYRQGVPLGRGKLAYRFLIKPYALDINDLSAAAWARLFETACGLEEGDVRSALVDSILDWTDADSVQRAYGAEEDFYLALDPPRHCRNAPFETVEELLLVNGMTPELLFGYGHPVYIENGLLLGGGLYRFLIGDNSLEAQATVQYIRRGILPSEDRRSSAEATETDVYQKVTVLPKFLYLAAEGFVPRIEGEEDPVFSEMQERDSDDSLSRYIILVKLVLPENTGPMTYTVSDFQSNASGELLKQVLMYGIEEDQDEL